MHARRSTRCSTQCGACVSSRPASSPPVPSAAARAPLEAGRRKRGASGSRGAARPTTDSYPSLCARR
eukprot:scaffold108856_cov42-Phaeocystis_antarctica.AAC.1